MAYFRQHYLAWLAFLDDGSVRARSLLTVAGCLEQPRGVGGRLVALRYHLADFNLLLRRQLWAASADAPLFAGSTQPGLGPFSQHGPLELRECTNHLHHHSACRCRRVDGFGQTAEARPGFTEPLHDREYIAEGARQPVQFPDHQHITLAELVQKPVKFWPVPASAGGLFPIDAFAPGGLESRHLDGGVLIVGGDSGVADLHCSNVSPIESVTQYLFATHKAQKINFCRIVAKPDVCANLISTVVGLVQL